MNSEWYLDIFNSTYFDVSTNFVDQKVFKKIIINQKHDFHGQFLLVILPGSTYLIQMIKKFYRSIFGLYQVYHQLNWVHRAPLPPSLPPLSAPPLSPPLPPLLDGLREKDQRRALSTQQMHPDPTFEPPKTFQIAHPLQRVQIGPTKKIWVDAAVGSIASQHHARCPRRATNHSQIRHHARRSTQSIGGFGGVQFIGKTRPTPGCPTAFARYVSARHEICTQLARPTGLRRKC